PPATLGPTTALAAAVCATASTIRAAAASTTVPSTGAAATTTTAATTGFSLCFSFQTGCFPFVFLVYASIFTIFFFSRRTFGQSFCNSCSDIVGYNGDRFGSIVVRRNSE